MLQKQTLATVISPLWQHHFLKFGWVLAATVDMPTFFANLYNALLTFSLAFSTFFFAWAAFLYAASGADNERGKQAAKGALYAALVGLALAVLAGVVAGIVNKAANG